MQPLTTATDRWCSLPYLGRFKPIAIRKAVLRWSVSTFSLINPLRPIREVQTLGNHRSHDVPLRLKERLLLCIREQVARLAARRAVGPFLASR
jgi:hypothetical protein